MIDAKSQRTVITPAHRLLQPQPVHPAAKTAEQPLVGSGVLHSLLILSTTWSSTETLTANTNCMPTLFSCDHLLNAALVSELLVSQTH